MQVPFLSSLIIWYGCHVYHSSRIVIQIISLCPSRPEVLCLLQLTDKQVSRQKLWKVDDLFREFLSDTCSRTVHRLPYRTEWYLSTRIGSCLCRNRRRHSGSPLYATSRHAQGEISSADFGAPNVEPWLRFTLQQSFDSDIWLSERNQGSAGMEGTVSRSGTEHCWECGQLGTLFLVVSPL